VARAIDSEMKRTGTEHVWLDCRHFSKEKFTEHFPNIYEKCLSIGIDITKNMIPVAPAAHYSCGGIKTDEWGRSSIKNLYACGECASTGLHGANRLASNSLLEAMVFAHRCFLDIASPNPSAGGALDSANNKYTSELNDSKTPPTGGGRAAIPDWNATGTTEPKEMILITQSLKEVQQVMSDYVGIVRNNIRLQRALRRLDLLWEETEQLYESSTLSPQLLELRNMITVSYLIVKCASFRKESRGLHFNTDYPDKSELVQNIVL
jgi:L-aspartate oxidase